MGLKVALSAVLLAVAMADKDMPQFKYFELDAEPMPGTHFYPHSANGKRETPAPAPEEAPVAGTYKEFIISPRQYNPLPPYNPPPAPAGAWTYMPMFMPSHHGHPAPAPYHPAPAPYQPAPAPYQPAPAPYQPAPAPYHPAPAPDHPGPFHPDKMPAFKTYSFRVVAPAPEPESALLDIRQAKALEDDSSDINDLIDASPVKEAPIEEAFIPLEAPVEEAPIEEDSSEEAPIEEDSSEEESSEEDSSEEDSSEEDSSEEDSSEEVENITEEPSLEENVTEEPLNEESSTDPIDFSEVDDITAPLRVFRRISEKYQGSF